MATIGTLAVNVVANTQGLQTGLAKAANSAKQLKKPVSALSSVFSKFGPAALAIGAVAAALSGLRAIARGISDSFAFIDKLAKVSAKLGLTIKALAGLRQAAELSGVATKTFDMALQRMTRRVAEAAQGTGEAKKALAELGLDAKKLSAAGPADAFIAIADAMKKVQSPADKLRLAFKLFDSEGAALVNTLNLGSDALREQIELSEKRGLAVSPEEARSIEAANNAWLDLTATTRGFLNQVAIILAPAFVAIGEALRVVVQRAVDWAMAFKRLTNNISEFLGMGPVVTATIDAETAARNANAAAVAEQAKQGTTLIESLEKQVELFGKSADQISRMKAEGLSNNAVITETREEFQSQIAGGTVGITTVRRGPSQRQVALDLLDTIKAMKEHQELMSRGATIAAQLATPQEKIANNIRDLNNLYQVGAIDLRTYQRGVAGAWAEVEKLVDKTKELKRVTTSGIGAATRGTLGGFSAVASGQRRFADTRRFEDAKKARDAKRDRKLEAIRAEVAGLVTVEVKEVSF